MPNRKRQSAVQSRRNLIRRCAGGWAAADRTSPRPLERHEHLAPTAILSETASAPDGISRQRGIGFLVSVYARGVDESIALAHAAPSLSDIMTPGLWETTINMQIDGMPMSLPAQTVRRCVTQKNLDENFGLPKPQTQGNVTCKATHMDRSGNTVDWGLACTGEGTLEADGTATFDSPEAYHATIHMTGTMQGRHIRMIQNLQGRRIGKCQS